VRRRLWSPSFNSASSLQSNCSQAASSTLYGLQSLKYISLQIFEVFNSKAEPNQVVLNPILFSLWSTQIPVFKFKGRMNWWDIIEPWASINITPRRIITVASMLLALSIYQKLSHKGMCKNINLLNIYCCFNQKKSTVFIYTVEEKKYLLYVNARKILQ